jgi:hypothetical protein
MATVSPRSLGAVAVTLAALVSAEIARADEPKPAEPAAWETAPATRRSGFVVGTAVGFGVGGIAGFPNDVKKIGYIPYYAVTGPRPAPLLSAWVGGALTDWLTFGVGVSASFVLGTGENRAESVAGLFHIEAFPLFYVSDRLRDLGVTFEAGAGTGSLTAPSGDKLVDASLASMTAAGAFWEGLAFWRIRGGPFVMARYQWSDTAKIPGVYAGFRLSLYTGKPRAADAR